MKKIVLLFLILSLASFSYAQTFSSDVSEENKSLISDCLKKYKDAYSVSLEVDVAQRGNSLWFYSSKDKSFLFREEINFLSSDTSNTYKEYSLYKNFFKASRGVVIDQDSLKEEDRDFVFSFQGISVGYRNKANFIRSFDSIEDAASELCASELVDKEAPKTKNIILLKDMIESSGGLLSVKDIVNCHTSSDFYRFVSLYVGKPKMYLNKKDVLKVIKDFED